MFRILLAAAFTGLMSVYACAQNSDTLPTKTGIQLSGSADTYYRYNLNAPGGSSNNYTKFTNSQNSFELGMASLKAQDSIGKVSATIDIGFGQRMNEYDYTANNNISSAVKQLFISYAVSNKIKFTVGKWYKDLGYESLDAYENKNYSMSYAFSFSPMFFTGIKTNIALTKQIVFMAGIANPADFFTTNTQTKTVIGGLSYTSKNKKVLIKVNGQGYSGISAPYQPVAQYQLYKDLFQFDVVAQWQASDKFLAAINYTDQTVHDASRRNFNSSVLYLNYKLTPTTELSLRNEYLKDRINSLRIGANIFASTLSANFRINRSLVILPEFRWDNGSSRIFQKSDFSGTENTFTALAAIIYSF